ncbi:MAG: OFA family MFS transporter, partial [Phycisphaerae bacterium]|nr:OFA family MFS transporter [Phycisphaerae bacterium]
MSEGIRDAGWGWTQAQLSMPYSIACLVFCLVMVPAGRLQDKIGPRLVASVGGILVGIGMIVASFTTSPIGYIVGFGVIAGAGIGFGYASATPPAVKWFPPEKTGLVAGIVVSGFGLASVYAAFLSRWLMTAYSLQTMMTVLGLGFMVVVVGLAQVLRPPHRVLQLVAGFGKAGELKKQYASQPSPQKTDYTPKEMLKTLQFYLLWFMYACGAGAGLMIISVAKKIGAGAEVGIAAVVGLAIGNGAGRVIAGLLSDKLGRKATMCACFIFQALLVFLLSRATPGTAMGSSAALVIFTALIGANYGANLALFPSITKDFYGLKNFGVNYGLVFTAWGVGGFMLAL